MDSITLQPKIKALSGAYSQESVILVENGACFVAELRSNAFELLITKYDDKKKPVGAGSLGIDETSHPGVKILAFSASSMDSAIVILSSGHVIRANIHEEDRKIPLSIETVLEPMSLACVSEDGEYLGVIGQKNNSLIVSEISTDKKVFVHPLENSDRIQPHKMIWDRSRLALISIYGSAKKDGVESEPERGSDHSTLNLKVFMEVAKGREGIKSFEIVRDSKHECPEDGVESIQWSSDGRYISVCEMKTIDGSKYFTKELFNPDGEDYYMKPTLTGEMPDFESLNPNDILPTVTATDVAHEVPDIYPTILAEQLNENASKTIEYRSEDGEKLAKLPMIYFYEPDQKFPHEYCVYTKIGSNIRCVRYLSGKVFVVFTDDQAVFYSVDNYLWSQRECFDLPFRLGSRENEFKVKSCYSESGKVILVMQTLDEPRGKIYRLSLNVTFQTHINIQPTANTIVRSDGEKITVTNTIFGHDSRIDFPPPLANFYIVENRDVVSVRAVSVDIETSRRNFIVHFILVLLKDKVKVYEYRDLQSWEDDPTRDEEMMNKLCAESQESKPKAIMPRNGDEYLSLVKVGGEIEEFGLDNDKIFADDPEGPEPQGAQLNEILGDSSIEELEDREAVEKPTTNRHLMMGGVTLNEIASVSIKDVVTNNNVRQLQNVYKDVTNFQDVLFLDEVLPFDIKGGIVVGGDNSVNLGLTINCLLGSDTCVLHHNCPLDMSYIKSEITKLREVNVSVINDLFIKAPNTRVCHETLDAFGNVAFATITNSILEVFVSIEGDDPRAKLYDDLMSKGFEVSRSYLTDNTIVYNILKRRVESGSKLFGLALQRYVNDFVSGPAYNGGPFVSLYSSRGNFERLRPKMFAIIELCESLSSLTTCDIQEVYSFCLVSRVSLIDFILLENGVEMFNMALHSDLISDEQLSRIISNTSLDGLTDTDMEAIRAIFDLFTRICRDETITKYRTMFKLAALLSECDEKFNKYQIATIRKRYKDTEYLEKVNEIANRDPLRSSSSYYAYLDLKNPNYEIYARTVPDIVEVLYEQGDIDSAIFYAKKTSGTEKARSLQERKIVTRQLALKYSLPSESLVRALALLEKVVNSGDFSAPAVMKLLQILMMFSPKVVRELNIFFKGHDDVLSYVMERSPSFKFGMLILSFSGEFSGEWSAEIERMFAMQFNRPSLLGPKQTCQSKGLEDVVKQLRANGQLVGYINRDTYMVGAMNYNFVEDDEYDVFKVFVLSRLFTSEGHVSFGITGETRDSVSLILTLLEIITRLDEDFAEDVLVSIIASTQKSVLSTVGNVRDAENKLKRMQERKLNLDSKYHEQLSKSVEKQTKKLSDLIKKYIIDDKNSVPLVRYVFPHILLFVVAKYATGIDSIVLRQMNGIFLPFVGQFSNPNIMFLVAVVVCGVFNEIAACIK